MHIENNRSKDMSKKVACLDWLAVPDPPPDNLQRTLPAREPPRSRLSFAYRKKAHIQNTQGIYIKQTYHHSGIIAHQQPQTQFAMRAHP